MEFANGWGTYGEAKYVVLSAGATPEEAVPFNEIRVERTFGYHQFDMFAENMKEEDGFARPTGKQKVWLTFRVGNGNLRSVKFYEEAIPEEEEGLQPWPSEMEGYEELTTVIDGSALVRAVEVPENPEEDPYKDAKYNEETGCWGSTNDGFIVKSNEEIDFGNGEFQQLVAYIGHDGERYTEYMEFYIDEVKPENMVARTWTGINIQEWNSFTPVATTLKEVTGSHYLYIKWEMPRTCRKSNWSRIPSGLKIRIAEWYMRTYNLLKMLLCSPQPRKRCHRGNRHQPRHTMGSHQAYQWGCTMRRKQHRLHQSRRSRSLQRHRLQGQLL